MRGLQILPLLAFLSTWPFNLCAREQTMTAIRFPHYSVEMVQGDPSSENGAALTIWVKGAATLNGKPKKIQDSLDRAQLVGKNIAGPDGVACDPHCLMFFRIKDHIIYGNILTQPQPGQPGLPSGTLDVALGEVKDSEIQFYNILFPTAVMVRDTWDYKDILATWSAKTMEYLRIQFEVKVE